MTTNLTEEELESILGPVAMREYKRAPDWDQVNIQEWAAGLQALSDENFIMQCASRVLDAALVESKGFKGNWEGTYSRSSACFHESKRRHQAAGHDRSCRGHTLYAEGFNRAYRSQGHKPSPPSACDCGAEEEKQ